MAKYSKNIIIGAGLSGLSCGYDLNDCTIFEQESSAGGLCRTYEFQKFRYDIGGHRFFTSNKNTEEFFKYLVGPNLLTIERKSKIYWKNRFIDYPLKVSVVFNLSPWQTIWCLTTYLYRLFKPLDGSSFDIRAKNKFGDNLYHLFLKNYTQKVWGMPCHNISKELVDIRLQNISLLRVIKHAFRKNQDIKSFSDNFLYPQMGIQEIIDRLAMDQHIHYNSRITGIRTYQNRIQEVEVNHNEIWNVDNLVSTIPLPQLISLLNAPQPVLKASHQLKYRNIILVFLILNRKRFTSNHWIYFPQNQIFGRLHEPKNWSPRMAVKDKTGVCLEIFCDPNQDIWNMPSTEIAHQVIRDMPLLKPFDVIDHCVHKIKYAYPVYDLNYRENLNLIHDHLKQFKNLYILGRTGAFRYINMDTCIEEGLHLQKCLKAKPEQRSEITCTP